MTFCWNVVRYKGMGETSIVRGVPGVSFDLPRGKAGYDTIYENETIPSVLEVKQPEHRVTLHAVVH